MFNEVSLSDIEKELSKLNTKKSSILKNIPAKILKTNMNSCSETLKTLTTMISCSEALKALFNKTVLTRNFHNELKLDDVIPVF